MRKSNGTRRWKQAQDAHAVRRMARLRSEQAKYKDGWGSARKTAADAVRAVERKKS